MNPKENGSGKQSPVLVVVLIVVILAAAFFIAGTAGWIGGSRSEYTQGPEADVSAPASGIPGPAGPQVPMPPGQPAPEAPPADQPERAAPPAKGP